MLLLAFRNRRARSTRTGLTALAIALGVGMIFAMRLFGVASVQSAREARENRLVGADLEVTGATTTTFPATLAAEIAARPEVDIANQEEQATWPFSKPTR